MTNKRPETYSAFISYSHAVDGELAPALQRALQRFAKPWYKARAIRVFRDEASLSANPALWPSIEAALDASKYFLLLASPSAATSPWVAREVAHWRATKQIDNLLIALTEGELSWDLHAGDFDPARTNAIPAALLGGFRDEPRFIDLRWAHASDQLSLSNGRFRDAVAELAAPIHEVPKDALAGEEVRQHRRTIRIARGAVATLAGLTLAALLFGVLALMQRNEARQQRDLATSRSLLQTAKANLDTRLDLAALLSIEAFRIDPSPETRSGLVGAIARARQVVGVRDTQQPIGQVTFSPDRDLVAAAGTRNISFWRVSEPGTPIAILPVRNAKALAFSPDGGTIAVAGPRAISVWDFDETPALERTFPIPSTLALSFLDDDLLGAVNTSGGVVLSTESGDRLRHWNLSGGVSAADFAANGSIAAVAGPRSLYVINMRGTARAIRRAAPGISRAVAVAPDGKRVAALDLSGNKVTTWALRTSTTHTWALAQPVSSLEFLPEGKRLVLGMSDGRIEIVSASRPLAGTTFQGIAGPIFDLAVPAGGPIAAGGKNGTIVLFDPKATHGQTVLGRRPPTFTLDFADGASSLVVGGFGPVIDLWALDSGSRLPKRIKAAGDQSSVAIDASAAHIAVSRPDGSVSLLDAKGHKTRLQPPTANAPGQPVAISSTGVVAWGAPGRVKRFSIRNSRQLSPIEVVGSPQSMAFSGDGEWLAVAGGRGVELVRLASDGVTVERVDDDQATSVSMSRSGDLLAYATQGRITVWDTKREQVRFVTSLPLDVTAALAFTSDGSTLAAGTSIGDVRFVDTETGIALGPPIDGPGGPVSDIDFDVSGQRLAVGTEGGVVSLFDDVLWDDVSAMRARLCDVAGRNLTAAEWREHLPGLAYRETCP